MISYFILYFNPSWAPLLLRVVFGGLLVVRGQKKIGAGFAGYAAYLESLRFRPGKVWAALVVAIECAGGLFLVAGLFTHFAAIAVALEFLIVIIRVRVMTEALRGDSQRWKTDLLFLSIAVSLLFTGPGAYSLDQILHFVWF